MAQGWKSLKSARLDLLFASRPGGGMSGTKGRTTPAPFQVAREGLRRHAEEG